MSVFFPKVYQVIRRNPGSYVNGVWTPAGESQPLNIAINIQPASATDYDRLQAMSSGRRVTAMMRVYADLDANLNVAGSNDHPGDIIIYNDQRWLVIGSTRWDVFGNSDTGHMRYMITLEAEHSAGEVMA